MCVVRHLEQTAEGRTILPARLQDAVRSPDCSGRRDPDRPEWHPNQVRVAQGPQRLGVLGRRVAPLEALDGAALNGDRPVEETEPRIADPGIVQRRRVDRHVGEVGERQHALEQSQRLIEPVPYELTGAELVQRERFVISIVRLGRAQRDLIEAPLRVVPSAELEEHLSLKSADVELKIPVVGSRRAARRPRAVSASFSCRSAELRSRAEKQLAAAQRVQSRVRRHAGIQQWPGSRQFALREKDLGAQQTKLPRPSGGCVRPRSAQGPGWRAPARAAALRAISRGGRIPGSVEGHDRMDGRTRKRRGA